MSATAGLVKAIEAYVEERLKELTKKLEYDEDEVTALMEANTEMAKQVKADHNNKKRRKRERDPNAPKKPLNAYMFFAKDESVRANLKKKNPEITQKELTVALGKRWGEMKEKERAPYVKQSEDDRKRYDKEVASAGGKASEKGKAAAAPEKGKKEPAKKSGSTTKKNEKPSKK